MARSNLQIATGSYTGDGLDSKIVTGLGFNPTMVIVKGGANIGAIRTKTMLIDSSALLVGSTAVGANIIQELINDGFVVGTAANVNTASTVYHYIAFGGTDSQNYFKVGRYYGNGTDNREYTDIGFQADLIGIKGESTSNFIFRTSAVAGDLSEFFNSTAESANKIQSITATGAQLGNGAEVNSTAVYYHYFAAKTLAGVIAVGTYTGDANATKSITGLGFQPSIVIVKSSSTQQARIKTDTETGTNCLFAGSAAEAANGITSFDADGFTVDNHATVNVDATTFYWMAFKTGTHKAPVTRTAV